MSPKRTLAVTLAGLLLLLLGACDHERLQLRVGAKPFAEQSILSQMVVALLKEHEIAVASPVPCADTYACQRAMQQRRLDLMVDYTGTGLAFLGSSADEDDSLASVRSRYAPLGLSWAVPLGFDNGYSLVVTPARAYAERLKTIADLERIPGGVRVACPASYLRRPGDGLASLVQRYGLRLAGEPLVIADPSARYRALFVGRADVAVGFGTDGALSQVGLTELSDPLEFFPPYEAVIVGRAALLKKRPALAKVLRKLEGRLTTRQMRRLNYKVQVEGEQAAVVARDFLRQRKLLSQPRTSKTTGQPVRLAIAADDRLGTLVSRATDAVRRVFTRQAVAVRRTTDPVRAVASGNARMALIGAERFFHENGGGSPVREDRVAALAVVGTRMFHLVAHPSATAPSAELLSGKIGVGPAGASSARVAASLARLASGTPVHGSHEQLLERVARRELPAALLLALPGEPAMAKALARPELRLRPLAHPRSLSTLAGDARRAAAMSLPYLRPARIPAQTYGGQPHAVETLGAQVVLAGPTRAVDSSGGPAAAIGNTLPITRSVLEKLAAATRVPSAPDPVLPSAWSPAFGAADKGDDEGGVLDTALNLGAVSFLIWLFWLVVRREPTPEPTPDKS